MCYENERVIAILPDGINFSQCHVVSLELTAAPSLLLSRAVTRLSAARVKAFADSKLFSPVL